MSKFDDFDLDLRENTKTNNDSSDRGTISEVSKLSLKYCSLSIDHCDTILSKVTCGESSNCLTKVSKCTGR